MEKADGREAATRLPVIAFRCSTAATSYYKSDCFAYITWPQAQAHFGKK